MSRTLNLFGTDSALTALAGDVGLLCEFATDSPSLRTGTQGAANCHRPDELLGSADDALIIAHSLVSKLTDGVAAVEGLPSLAILEESLLEQVSYSVQALHLDRWICSQGISECRFDSYSPWLDRLRQIRTLTESAYVLRASVPFGQANWVRRGIVDLLKSGSSASELFRRTAPLWSRYLSSVRIRKLARDAPRGGIWFYSTAYNFTKIALEYDAYFPRKMNFLVEDPKTGGKRLSELGRNFYPLYEWSRASDIPSASEVHVIADRITSAVASVALTEDESVLRTVLLKSEWWDHLMKRVLPFLLFHGRTLERWCDEIGPEMLVVGNAGWERSVLQSKGVERIPSIMLQHGIMHRVYAIADQPVTHFLIRGEFFQNLVNQRLRSKTIICNYPQESKTEVKCDSCARDSILFITMPYSVAPLFHHADLHDILRSLLRVSHSSGRRLVIRVHPLETISSYQRLASEIQRESELLCNIVYSQGAQIEEILARSCVAVLYFSTMFLDCLRHGIPIVSLDWHQFPNKRNFQQEGIFNLASDLHDLEQLVQRAINGDLPSQCASLEKFLAPTKPEEILKILNHLWASRPALSDVPAR
jgi:hypothetical protein